VRRFLTRRWVLLAVAALVVVAAVAGGAVAVLGSGSGGSGRWIAFAASPGGTPPNQVFRVREDGGGLRQVTDGDLPAAAPSFSPDGERIVFARLGGGIFSAKLNGSDERRLTSNARDTFPVWSPDGDRVAFIRASDEGWQLHVVGADGTGERRLLHAPPAGRPTWTSDGRGIVIPSAGGLVRVDSQEGRPQKYFEVPINPQFGQSAAVSPDGRSVVFLGPRLSTGPPDCGEGRCPQFALYRAEVSSSQNPRRIDADAGPAGWSPDGAKIVYLHRGALVVRDLGDGTTTTIATGEAFPAADAPPAWQPSSG
jgi:Tol biopolymer transport system component